MALLGEVIRINLSELEIQILTSVSGKYAYYGNKGLDGEAIKNSITINVNLTNIANPTLSFKTWYDMEFGWDFASIQVREVGTNKWKAIEGNITTIQRDADAVVIVDHGITGTSKGWIDGVFDLSEFVGKNIELKFEYETDMYTFGQGFYVDDIKIVNDEVDDEIIFNDDAEDNFKFNLDGGFTRNKGFDYATNYYLIEWRNHHGVDKGLANINVGSIFEYDPGMVVWYVNEYYTENWTGVHPGSGYLSVVDADQTNISWVFGDKSAIFASNKMQMHDAAFSLNKVSKFVVDLSEAYNRMAIDKFSTPNNKFTDKKDFSNNEIAELGAKLPDLGLDIQILKQEKENSEATIRISKK